ncbi:MAG: TIGR03618 family F420-dependent PPOX class oxidoreductase [Chloroflexi bacterium]|nr:TIGR03618 family F420-dependent PPOX class oxidoreductase [Chloroflexota bacterium]
MPLDPNIQQFVADNPQGVLTTYRRNGKAQMSIVTVRPHRDAIGISITETRAKFHNLARNPACSLLISTVDWWSGFIVVDGNAELIHSGNTESETLRLARREIYSATTRRRSTDWDEYDKLVDDDKRVAVILRPDHVYGTALDPDWPGARISGR